MMMNVLHILCIEMDCFSRKFISSHGHAANMQVDCVSISDVSNDTECHRSSARKDVVFLRIHNLPSTCGKCASAAYTFFNNDVGYTG